MNSRNFTCSYVGIREAEGKGAEGKGSAGSAAILMTHKWGTHKWGHKPLHSNGLRPLFLLPLCAFSSVRCRCAAVLAIPHSGQRFGLPRKSYSHPKQQPKYSRRRRRYQIQAKRMGRNAAPRAMAQNGKPIVWEISHLSPIGIEAFASIQRSRVNRDSVKPPTLPPQSNGIFTVAIFFVVELAAGIVIRLQRATSGPTGVKCVNSTFA